MVLVFAHFLSFFFGIKTKFPMYHVENFGVFISTLAHPKLTDVLRMVRDDPKVLDDGGEIPKSEGRGWRFDSRL